MELNVREQKMRLYIVPGVPKDTVFETQTRKEISKIDWWKLSDLPTLKREKQLQQQGLDLPEEGAKASNFYMVAPFLGQLLQGSAQPLNFIFLELIVSLAQQNVSPRCRK